jgi:hypothetical protein
VQDSPVAGAPPPGIDVSRPHTARMYDYYLGGENHYPADRELADKVLASMPAARTAARENRAFMGRAVRFLAEEIGLRQFLDIGTGLPTSNSVHEVAQAVAPSARVVYADNDPLVLAHARALLTSSPAGRTAYLQADLRDPESILARRPAPGQLPGCLARHHGARPGRARRRARGISAAVGQGWMVGKKPLTVPSLIWATARLRLKRAAWVFSSASMRAMPITARAAMSGDSNGRPERSSTSRHASASRSMATAKFSR